MIVNQTLTNFAQGFAQQSAAPLARFLAPRVPTGGTNGDFKKFNNRQDFQVYRTTRPVGGGRTRIQFGETDGTYNCKPNGLEIVLDVHERKQAGAMELQLQQAKIRTLVSVANVALGSAIIAAAKAGVTATSGSGDDWAGSDDPIAEIDAEIETIATATGMMPNRIIFGLTAWKKFRNNAKVKARVGSTKDTIIRPEMVRDWFLNPQMEIMVSMLTTDTATLGKDTASKANKLGDDVFVFLEPGNPTQYDPGFMRTFSTEETGVDAVREYELPDATGTAYFVDWTQDIQVVSTISAGRIAVAG